VWKRKSCCVSQRLWSPSQRPNPDPLSLAPPLLWLQGASHAFPHAPWRSCRESFIVITEVCRCYPLSSGSSAALCSLRELLWNHSCLLSVLSFYSTRLTNNRVGDPIESSQNRMQAFRATIREASRRAPAGVRLVRGYASGKTYEHLLVSSPKPGVGFSTYLRSSFTAPIRSSSARLNNPQSSSTAPRP
jgi:hypothetical protein